MPRPARDAGPTRGGAHGLGTDELRDAGPTRGGAHDPGTNERRDASGRATEAAAAPRPAAPTGPRAADLVADAVRTGILSGELAPGTPLREEELSAIHGVSRHTARTALATLTAERLATAEPYRGVRVALLDDDALVALQQLRCALETEALRIVREVGIHPPGVDAALDDLAAAETAGDWPATLAAHARVHLALVEAAGSPRIAEEYRRLDSEMHLLLTHVRPAYAPGSLTAEHRAYVAAALADPERAVRAHLEHSTRAIIDGRRSATRRHMPSPLETLGAPARRRG
ncbi:MULTISPECIES: GntR family transcriptional regulator [Microbacterium]|uniref:GntR family transcriptional regulator n=1 Tax=Microbacterium TaxID=33882 RepID=UPI002788DFF8|nr:MULTISPECIES: GntR family transcriptional regulator [Microbacterium]MDQ1083071.1 DNA-binding GntR family transcriptional regulator [Microbacterium sp. SORGH_AS_0344]MDQ1171657.1 DNA-binding GntR family transcriptional regulator [Microbacterium proteolyticum]